MANLENVIFALSGTKTYFFNAPSFWSWGGIDPDLEKELAKRTVKDYRCISIGADPINEYFINYVHKDDPDRVAFWWGDGIPTALRDFIADSENKTSRDRSLHVVLGPSKSFIAWDQSSIRWSDLPSGLEETIQEWLSPQGWTRGPPQLVALGADGAFFARSEYGACSWSLPATWPELQKTLSAWKGQLGQIEKIYLNPALNDSFIIVLKNTGVMGNHMTYLGPVPTYREAAESFASDELKASYAAFWKEVEEEEQRKRKEEEAKMQRKKEEEKKQSEARQLRMRLYIRWKRTCNAAFAQGTMMKEFPALPVEACTCEIQSCWERKVEKMLFACRHDVEGLLRGSSEYSLAWLRRERLAWHPDRFGQKCSPEVREDFSKRATELYTIFGELIEAESPN